MIPLADRFIRQKPASKFNKEVDGILLFVFERRE